MVISKDEIKKITKANDRVEKNRLESKINSESQDCQQHSLVTPVCSVPQKETG